MKDIKFRQWQPETKRFLYIYQMQAGDTVRAEFILHNGELQQYTGLKDKDGKEIYEGDILCVPNCHFRPEEGDAPNLLLEVKFDNGWFFAGEFGLYEYDQPELEIIGNINENSELLN